jgi:hypothetical protein
MWHPIWKDLKAASRHLFRSYVSVKKATSLTVVNRQQLYSCNNQEQQTAIVFTVPHNPGECSVGCILENFTNISETWPKKNFFYGQLQSLARISYYQYDR